MAPEGRILRKRCNGCARTSFPLTIFKSHIMHSSRLAVSPKSYTHPKKRILADVSIFEAGLDWLFLLINWTKRKVLKETPLLYIMKSSQVIKSLYQVLVNSNLQLCELINQNGFDIQDLYDHFKFTAEKISEFSDMIEGSEL